MKIWRKMNYRIELRTDPCSTGTFSGILKQSLSFTGAELIDAIVSAGMPDVYLTGAERRKRKEEIDFKKNLFETFVVAAPSGELAFDPFRRKYLDSTEVGVINYWIGMILTTLLGKQKYGYEFMVHLSKLRVFSSPLEIHKRLITITGEATGKTPDLLAVNLSPERYGVFEAKGYSEYSKKAMENAHAQAKAIEDVNGKKPDNCIAVMSLTKGSKISMLEKDPESEGLRLKIDPNLLYLYHFLPIVELITELEPEERGDRMYGSLRYGDDCHSISVPSNVYHELSEIAQSDQYPFSYLKDFEAFFNEEHLSHLTLERSEGRILRIE